MSDNQPAFSFRIRLEVLLISQREDILLRVQQKVSQYDFAFRHLHVVSNLPARDLELERTPIFVVSQEESEEVRAFSLRVEQLLERFPLVTIVAVMQDSALMDNFAGTRSERVIPLSPYDFFKTNKLEYLCLLKCRSQFFDIAPSDLFPMTTLGFSVFVRMHLNQRYLGIAFRGLVLGDLKHQKMSTKRSLYIQVRESLAYLDYINAFNDAQGAALRKRVRALFLAMCAVGVELNEHLLFDCRNMPEPVVRQLYSRLEQFAAEFEFLAGVGEDLWETLKDSIKNDFFAKWRAPWIAFYAAYISKKSGVGSPSVSFLAGLFCDVGLFDTQDLVVEKFLGFGEEVLDGAEQVEYRKHPLLSLNRCLFKNLPISEEIKSVLMCVHERDDSQGFPNQTPPELLPPEAAIIRFAELIDKGNRMASSGCSFRVIREKIWEEQRSKPGSFNLELLEKISESLL
ncbi:MAG: hypothetical protein ACM3MG_05350 [Bacillota bacterium]